MTRTNATAGPDDDGLPTPAALQVSANHVRAGDGFAMTFAAVGYPRVGPSIEIVRQCVRDSAESSGTPPPEATRPTTR